MGSPGERPLALIGPLLAGGPVGAQAAGKSDETHRDAEVVMSQPEAPLRIEPFSIRVEEEVLSDLRARIRNTRWPDRAPGAAWEQGTDLEYLKQVVAYWADGFDWRAQERALNAFDQFRA